jgi:uncharacterized protein (TIGR02246 family)
MTRLLMVLATVIAMSHPAQAGPPQAGAAMQKADPAIAKIVDAYVAGVKARDTAKIAELYAEDAVEMPPFRQPLKGRQAIRSHYEQMFKGEQMQFSDFSLKRLESMTSGDIAFETGTYSQRVTPKGGQQADDTGNYMVLLRRAADGQWRVAYAIYNSHNPPPGAAR